MGVVAKYNTFKAISTLLTVGTPIITLCACSDLFVHRSETAISAAGLFAILVTILLFKDKIAENFKMPSALVLSASVFTLIILLEKILLPVKYVCIATMIASAIDEISFKRMYKSTELSLPDTYKAYKHFGFIFTMSSKL